MGVLSSWLARLTVNQVLRTWGFESLRSHMMTLPCFTCGKNLESAIKKFEETENQPYAGTTFSTHGQYGSTVFDPMNLNKWLEINICDDCMLKGRERILIAIRQPEEISKSIMYEPWNPFKHN